MVVLADSKESAPAKPAVQQGKSMKATLSLNVKYSGKDANEKVIRALLEDVVMDAARDGLLSGKWDMEVDEYDYKVSFPPPTLEESLRKVIGILRDEGWDEHADDMEKLL